MGRFEDRALLAACRTLSGKRHDLGDAQAALQRLDQPLIAPFFGKTAAIAEFGVASVDVSAQPGGGARLADQRFDQREVLQNDRDG